MLYAYEIFLKHAQIDKLIWRELLQTVSHYLGSFTSWQIYIVRAQNTLHYYLATPKSLPCSLNLTDFLFQPCSLPTAPHAKRRAPYFNAWSSNFVTVLQDFQKKHSRLNLAVISLHSFGAMINGHIDLYFTRGEHSFTSRMSLFSPQTFLSIDFTKSKSFLFKKFPKYLKFDQKITKLLTTTSASALFEVTAFPYLDRQYFLPHNNYDFAKHSLVIGSSGSGKSRFLASLIAKIDQHNSQPTPPSAAQSDSRSDSQLNSHLDFLPNSESALPYKIVVIDPHDALYRECVQVASQSVINFQNLPNSIDLFSCKITDINAHVELMLTLFHSLLNDSYNGRLERVLRYATYLLTVAEHFSFLTLRKLLLDLEYRNYLVQAYRDLVPVSVTHFFLTDFNELRSQNYNDAIAPIIAFIDEMQMLPVFNSEHQLTNLSEQIQNHFLNIFSLNRLKLGSKVTQTIAGLLMQQLFLLAEQSHDYQLIVIIDEVAVVENPILARFLSELRKYHVAVILASQYFDQISPTLQSAIFANVANFYLFRTSRHDAELLTQNLSIQVEGSNDANDAVKLLTNLKQRECLVRLSAQEELLPIFKARTTDFLPPTAPPNPQISDIPVFVTKNLTFPPANFAQKPTSENKQFFPQPQKPPESPKITEKENKKFFPSSKSSKTFPTFQINTNADAILKSYSTGRQSKNQNHSEK